MQKFTRALTREIEVAGKALAVTLDENGLSIKPVGSRQAPLTLSWAACLCAAAAPPAAADREVARVLEGLGEGGAPSSPKAGSEVPALLGRLEGWLKKRRRRYFKGLRPGATEAELAELARALGKPVPAELADWLRWHNGQDEDLIGAFVESFNLMSAQAVIAALSERKGQAGWKSAWVPILDDYQGDLVVLDTSRPGCPVLERWEGRDDTPEVAPSLEAWLTALVGDVEAGRYHEDPERGEFVRGREA